MSNQKTVNYQGQIYEYGIDKALIIWVKVGSTFIGADKPCQSKPNDEEIKAIAINILTSHFNY